MVAWDTSMKKFSKTNKETRLSANNKGHSLIASERRSSTGIDNLPTSLSTSAPAVSLKLEITFSNLVKLR